MLRTRVRAGPIAGLVLSLVFAVLLTVVQLGDRWVRRFEPVWGAPTPITLRAAGGPRLGRDEAGRVRIRHTEAAIVPRGTVLSPASEAHQAAVAVARSQRQVGLARVAGVFGIFFTLCMAVTSYLRGFGQNRLKLLRVQVGLLGAMALLVTGAKAFLLGTSLPEFWIPIAAVPLWVATSFDRRTAFVVTVVLALAIASLLSFDTVLLAVLLSRGMAATLLYFDRKRRQPMVVAALLAGLCAAAVYVALRVTFDGAFSIAGDLARGAGSDLLACLGGGGLGGLLGAVLSSPGERLLGHVPRDRLLDLTDLEQPLLQRLASDAPGTWEHSRAMANLAEQAASAIGADALLTRVGAYYHDVGKAAQAKYFVENLGPDERSPHDALDPEVSADAIMAHVVIGAQMLRSGGVPEAVVEFTYTHHGTQVVEFFWNKCQQQGNPKQLTEEAFRYPGMKPQTKETAILMLVDSIEAASRTVDPPERQRFEEMIQRVLFTKLQSGQLDECGLDLADLRVVARRMGDTLVNMNHHRVKYPWQVQRAEEFGVPSSAMRDSSPVAASEPLTVAIVPPGTDVEAPSPTVAGSLPSSLPISSGLPTPGAPTLAAVGQTPDSPPASGVMPLPEPSRPAKLRKLESTLPSPGGRGRKP